MKKLLLVCLFLLLLFYDDAFGWQRRHIGSIKSPIYLIVADLDADGDSDVAAGAQISAEPVDSEVAWFENDLAASGTFIKHLISPAAAGSATFPGLKLFITARMSLSSVI